MRRREFMTLVGGAAAGLAVPPAARAQQPAMPLLGVLSPASVSTGARNVAALRQALRDLGYIDGDNIKIEYRFAAGSSERLAILAAELVALKPAVIVVGSTLGIVSASKATQTVPLIAVGGSGDPLQIGLAESFARPGRNVTGFILNVDQHILGKKLQLLRDAVPGISRVGIIGNPESPGDAAEWAIVPSAAERLGLKYQLFEVRSLDALDTAFAAAARDDMQGLYVSWSPVFNANRARVVAKAAALRLPAIYGFREFALSGGLMSYGPDLPDLYRRSAAYVDKILKGQKPGELPFQVAERYELVINLPAARALGLAIPPSLMARIDEIIE